ncbi:hypothetical protein J7J13_01270 [bacterium]|nr:hypothetical protein [bacterium]
MGNKKTDGVVIHLFAPSGFFPLAAIALFSFGASVRSAAMAESFNRLPRETRLPIFFLFHFHFTSFLNALYLSAILSASLNSLSFLSTVILGDSKRITVSQIIIEVNVKVTMYFPTENDHTHFAIISIKPNMLSILHLPLVVYFSSRQNRKPFYDLDWKDKEIC